jgi:hypothetical protein
MNPFDRLLEALRQEFELELAAKTGWGRKEVIQAFDLATTKALLRFVNPPAHE